MGHGPENGGGEAGLHMAGEDPHPSPGRQAASTATITLLSPRGKD